MPKFQVIIKGKDNEPEAYDIKADKWETEAERDVFYLGEKAIAWFKPSEVVAIINKEAQEKG